MSSPAAIRTPFVQGSPEWVDARNDIIGSSDIPIITGNSPYKTSRFALWAYKGRHVPLPAIDPETQELFDLGHALEPVIAERYALTTGRPLRRANRLLIHPSIPWAGASLDRVSAVKGERRIVELKWQPHRRTFDDGPEPVPAGVQDQVQWQLMVSGYDVADVSVLSGSHVEVYPDIGPDDSYQADLLYLAKDFRRRIELGEPPPIDASDATKSVLHRLYPDHSAPFLDPTAELEALARKYLDGRVLRDLGEEQVGLARNLLLNALQGAGGVDGDDYRVRVRQNKPGMKVAWESVAKGYRRLLEALTDRESLPARAVEVAEEIAPGVPLDELLTAIVSLHSTTTDGAHVLTVRSFDEELGKWV